MAMQRTIRTQFISIEYTSGQRISLMYI